MVADMAVSLPDRRTPTGEGMVGGHLDPTMLIDPGNR